MATVTEKTSARDRLLAAANELFYEEGIHTVGIDRVIEKAGVAKASLYNTFGSKEELVRAYLASRHERRQARIARYLTKAATPKERMLAVFDAHLEAVNDPTFKGCAFINANAEGKSADAITQLTDDYRSYVRDLFISFAEEARVNDPRALAAQLVLLYDGGTIGAQMDRNPNAVASARIIAESLIDGAVRAADEA